MSPRFGVYPFDEDLYYYLLEAYDFVDNRRLLHDILLEPFLQIKKELDAGNTNPYILRERFRRTTTRAYKDVGPWFPLPEWENIQHDDWLEDCDLGDWVYEASPEWTLFGEGAYEAYEILEELYDDVTQGCSASEIVRKILELGGTTDLILASVELDRIYVVRSSKVMSCSDVNDSHTGFHAFEHIGDALVDGSYPTYTFDDAFINELGEWQVEIAI